MKFFNQTWINRTTIAVIILAVTLLNLIPRTSAVAANENVQVWLTLADGSKKLVQESDLNFTAGSGSGTVITVNPSTLYQKFEGAGAAMTDSSAWLIANKLSAPQRTALMNNLFTRSGDGVGISYLRVPMGASDFALNSYTYDDMPTGQTDPTLANFSTSHDDAYIIPSLQAALALNPSLRLMGTPWSAPAWMKDNENLNAGALLPAYKQAFADYHVKFVQAYAAAGLPIDAITPQNEPMNATASYPSMGMSAAEQLDFIKNNLGPAFATAGLSTKILALDHNWDLSNYPLTILNDPAAAAYVDGTAFHCYAGNVANQSTVHNAYPNKGVWFTECSGGAWATDFGDNMSWNMKNLVIGNFRNWGKSLLLWNLALDESAGPTNGGCANCRGVVTIDSATGAVTYNEEYYILGHVSKFVDPAAYRAESTAYADGQPENVAFLNPDGSLSLIVHSSAASTFDVEWGGQHFSYSLPAKGTVTFKWNTGSTPGATATSAPTATSAATSTPYPAGELQPFESEGTYYTDYQATTSLSTESVHGGTTSMKSFSSTGEWHTVGAYMNNHPINASGFEKICLWVNDTTAADNTMGFRLVDSTGASQEIWSDNAAVGSNPKTVSNTWVQMCFKTSAYTLVDLTKLDKVQMAFYWAGTYYFDDITGVAPAPTATPTNTDAPTATVTPTVTMTATPYPAGALQPFETEGTYYNDYQVTPSLSTSVVHGGNSSLLSYSDTGSWHTVGAYFDNRPINATGYEKICWWVNDTTAADNDLAFKLFDATGASQEFWSSNPVIGTNTKTVSNTWVQMCFKLSAYTGINLAQLDKMQIAVYWAGTYYFDDVTGLAPEAATATPTQPAAETSTATPTLTATVTVTPTQTPTRTNTPGAVTLSFTSNSAEDGWVRESSENSNVGGALDVSAKTLRLGDDAFNRQYRTILSFNTSSLPDSAQITSVVLKLKKTGGFVGGNPFTALGKLWADIRQGAFGGNPALALTDFNAPASAQRVGAFASTPVSGWYIDMLNATGRSKINKIGLTQLRIYFATGDNNNNAATLLNLLSGNNANNKPVLVITYILP